MAESTISAVRRGLVSAMYGEMAEGAFVRAFLLGWMVCESVQEKVLAAKSTTGGRSTLAVSGVGNGDLDGNWASTGGDFADDVDLRIVRKEFDKKSGIDTAALVAVEDSSGLPEENRRRLWPDANDRTWVASSPWASRVSRQDRGVARTEILHKSIVKTRTGIASVVRRCRRQEGDLSREFYERSFFVEGRWA